MSGDPGHDAYLTHSTFLKQLQNPDDQESWAEFCALYRPLLVRYLRSCRLDPHDADDIVQEMMLSTLRPALARFKLDRSRGRFRSWLFQLTVNAVRDWNRRKASYQRAKDRIAQNAEVAAPPTDDELSRIWEESHRRHVLEYALRLIKARSEPRTWDCFDRHVLQGLPAAGVGADFGISANAVYTNAHRVTVRVRELCWKFDEDMADEDDVGKGAARGVQTS